MEGNLRHTLTSSARAAVSLCRAPRLGCPSATRLLCRHPTPLQHPASQEHPGLKASASQGLSLRALGSDHFRSCIFGVTTGPGWHPPALHLEPGLCLSTAPKVPI